MVFQGPPGWVGRLPGGGDLLAGGRVSQHVFAAVVFRSMITDHAETGGPPGLWTNEGQKYLSTLVLSFFSFKDWFILFYVCGYFAYMCVAILMYLVPVEVKRMYCIPLGLELNMSKSHQVGAGNGLQVLCKSNKCS